MELRARLLPRQGTLTSAATRLTAQNNETHIFEDNQADLEHAVEGLSGMIEQPIEPDTIAQLRADVTNKSAYVHKRHEVLLDDTLRLSFDNRWEYSIEI